MRYGFRSQRQNAETKALLVFLNHKTDLTGQALHRSPVLQEAAGPSHSDTFFICGAVSPGTEFLLGNEILGSNNKTKSDYKCPFPGSTILK